MAGDTRKITVGRDYYERVEGDVISGDHAQKLSNSQELADSITSHSPKEDVARLLKLVQQELAKLDVPEETKEEVAIELKAAEVQVKKTEPDKVKIADRLTGAANALKEAGSLGAQAVALGNMIGKAILWCGVQWTLWKYGS